MANPNQMTEAENAGHPAGVPIDPFAVDFFGGRALPAEEETFAETASRGKKAIKSRKKSDWYKTLPRLTNREAQFSNLLSNLPADLNARAASFIAETLTRYNFSAAAELDCSVFSVREVNLNQAIQNLNESPKAVLTVGAQNENSAAIVALNTDYAVALIESILGAPGTPPGNRRELSPIETTIIEFLAVKILGEVNDFLGESLLFLRNAGSPTTDFYEPFERGAEIILSLRAGASEDFINLLAPPGFLRVLAGSRNPLFRRKAERKNLSDFEKFAHRLDLRLQIGMTVLDADSLSYLEPDDIVLIEEPQIGMENDYFAGANLQLFVGSGGNFRLRGALGTDEFNGGPNFRIEEILSEEARRALTPAKFKMDEQEKDLTSEEVAFEAPPPADEEPDEEIADEQISPSLENVQVALRVEIAGGKISLRELQNLRSGQIIALGASPHDPVRLVTDNNEEPVATGELVEIEGQLGVRLTKVFI